MPTFPKRRRATAIVEHPEGILVTLMRYMACALRGGVQPGESDEAAVIRELREETGLAATKVIFLFRYERIIQNTLPALQNCYPTPSLAGRRRTCSQSLVIT